LNAIILKFSFEEAYFGKEPPLGVHFQNLLKSFQQNK